MASRTDAQKIERYAPHLRLNREWGFIFRSIKGVVLFNNWRDTRARTVQFFVRTLLRTLSRDTRARTVQRINFRPEQGDSQAGDKVGDRKNDSAKHYYAGNYAAKAPF